MYYQISVFVVFKIIKSTNGITNSVYKIKTKKRKYIILRKFGENTDKNIRESLIKYYKNNTTSIDLYIIDLYIIDLYSLISHYYWECRVLLQSEISNIDFNYIEYSNKRFDLFLKYYNIISIKKK